MAAHYKQALVQPTTPSKNTFRLCPMNRLLWFKSIQSRLYIIYIYIYIIIYVYDIDKYLQVLCVNLFFIVWIGMHKLCQLL
jgi:hypothetical protein